MNQADQLKEQLNQHEESAYKEYLHEIESPYTEEPTLADIDPYEDEQFEQESRDSPLEKNKKWLAHLILFGIRKPR
jgi:hypothetical protein